MRPRDFPSDLAFCDEMLPKVSRTFALSIQSLPAGLREPICVAYLLCRAVDTVEDDRRIAAAHRQSLFSAFDVALSAAAAGDPGPAGVFVQRVLESDLGATDEERTLCRGGAALFRAFAALPAAQRAPIESRVAEMSRGMRHYSLRADAQGGLRLEDLPDLERYCYFVAGTVGELLTELFAQACPLDPAVCIEAHTLAVSFGIGLQLVNILKDVAEDSLRNDLLLPRRVAEDHGVDLGRLFEPGGRPNGVALLRTLSLRARHHLERAERYTLLWPASASAVRLFCAVPLALALGTLREIELGDDALCLGRAPSVSRAFVGGVFAETVRAASLGARESDRAFRDLFSRARAGVAVRPARPAAPSDARPRDVDVRG